MTVKEVRQIIQEYDQYTLTHYTVAIHRESSFIRDAAGFPFLHYDHKTRQIREMTALEFLARLWNTIEDDKPLTFTYCGEIYSIDSVEKNTLSKAIYLHV